MPFCLVLCKLSQLSKVIFKHLELVGSIPCQQTNQKKNTLKPTHHIFASKLHWPSSLDTTLFCPLHLGLLTIFAATGFAGAKKSRGTEEESWEGQSLLFQRGEVVSVCEGNKEATTKRPYKFDMSVFIWWSFWCNFWWYYQPYHSSVVVGVQFVPMTFWRVHANTHLLCLSWYPFKIPFNSMFEVETCFVFKNWFPDHS